MFELSPCGDEQASCIDFALSEGASEDERRWWVLHTKPRQEKALASDLSARRVIHYLPTIEAGRAYRSKKTSVELPLFQGYLFLFALEADRIESLRTRRVVSTLEVHDQLLFRRDLSQIRRVIASREAMSLYPRLRDGARCRVTVGALKGLTGVVIGARQRRKFLVSVHALGQAISLEIDAAWLEPISE